MVRFVVLAWLVVRSATAAASPLEPLWDVPSAGACTDDVLAIDGALAVLHDRTLTPIDPATGARGAPRQLAGTQPITPGGRSWLWPDTRTHVLDGVIASQADHAIAGHDARTGQALWSRELGSTPTLRRAGGALLVDHSGPTDEVIIERIDPHTGAAGWIRALPSSFRALRVAFDARRLYLFSTPSWNEARSFVAALELATGAVVWSIEVASTTDPHDVVLGVASADAGLVVNVAKEGLRVLDPATGAERRRIAASSAEVVVQGARAYVALANEIRAIDLATGARAWSAVISADRALLASDRHFLLARDDAEILHALDLATGADLATWAAADQDLVYVHDDDRAPMLVLCGGGRLLALDPRAPARPVEHATITGRVTCAGCGRDVPAARSISVADLDLPLVRGAFRATFAGRGRIAVYAEPGDLSVFRQSAEYKIDMCRRVIVLDGRRRYELRCEIRVTHNQR